jgi:hypothetical protein
MKDGKKRAQEKKMRNNGVLIDVQKKLRLFWLTRI